MAKRRRSPKRRAKPADTKTGRTGLPSPESVKESVTFTSPGGRRYKILKTTEQDEYDPPPKRRRPKK
jgi:hypothetical protein